MKTTMWVMSGLLIALVVVPAVLLGLMVAPWFFLLLLLLAVIPLLFINRGLGS